MQFRVPLNNVTVTFVGRLSFCLESLVNFFELKNTVTLLPYPQPIFLSQNIENQNQTIDQTQTPSDELLLGPPKDMQPQETAAQPLGIIDFGKIEPNKKQRNAFINLIENHFRNQENNLDITPQDIVKAFDGTKTDKFLIDDSRESIECITNELNASDCFAKTDRGTYAYIDAEAYSPPDRIYSGYYEMIYHALEILHILTRSTGIRFPTRHISRLMDGWKFRVHTVSSPIGVFNKKKAFHSTFSKVRDKKYTVIMYSDGLYGLLKFCPEVQKESTDVQGPKDYIDLLVRDANNRRVPNDQDYNDLKECKVTFIIGSEMSAKIEKSIELASGIQPSPPSQKVCEKKPPKTADDKTSVPRSKSPKVIESDSDTSEEIEIESSTESPVEEEESFEANNNADEIDEISEDYESEAWPFENHWDPPEIVVTDFEPQSMFNYSHTILKPRDKADLNELSPPMSDYSPKKSMSSELESLRSQYKNFSLKKAAQFLYQKSGMNKPAKEFESDVWYAVGQTEPWVIAKGK
ncbi:hypothetical protein GPJ56_002806 [Histomonas meleagridis]|uniref:uncharacterized protein n=1 Tax=Histomonas meleagridis TaxID=135588 RepID=UPI00355A7511|nr:hypothetical protein GPJ56_002806 [Histomonas meleagridis]KAH0806322.1 hypothetical protein GO595_001010 [Histomonas meleagridis]